MFKLSHQPIPALGTHDLFPDAWAWAVFDGMVAVARFGNQFLAEEYCDWRVAQSRGLVPSLHDYQQMQERLAEALRDKAAAEYALQAFVEGKLIVRP